jgi:hypothetical protein
MGTGTGTGMGWACFEFSWESVTRTIINAVLVASDFVIFLLVVTDTAVGRTAPTKAHNITKRFSKSTFWNVLEGRHHRSRRAGVSHMANQRGIEVVGRLVHRPPSVCFGEGIIGNQPRLAP